LFIENNPDLTTNNLNIILGNSNEESSTNGTEQYFNDKNIETYKNIIWNNSLTINNQIIPTLNLFIGTNSIDMLKLYSSGDVSIKEIDNKSPYEAANIIYTNNNNYLSALYLSSSISNNQYAYLSLRNNEVGSRLLKNTLFGSSTSASIFFWSKIDIDSYNSLSFPSFFKFDVDDSSLIINPIMVSSNFGSDSKSLISETAINNIYNVYKNDWLLYELQLNNISGDNIDNYQKLNIDLYVHTKNNNILSSTPLTYENKPVSISLKDDSTLISGNTFDMTFGYPIESNYYNGYLRNLLIFDDRLTDDEKLGLFNAGIQPLYNFKNNSLDTLNLIKKPGFYLGLIGSYDNLDININNCVLRYNGKSYEI
jgi:hypothetical protein